MNGSFVGGQIHHAAVQVLASRKRKIFDQVKRWRIHLGINKAIKLKPINNMRYLHLNLIVQRLSFHVPRVPRDLKVSTFVLVFAKEAMVVKGGALSLASMPATNLFPFLFSWA